MPPPPPPAYNEGMAKVGAPAGWDHGLERDGISGSVDAMERGVLAVTANERAARALRSEFDRRRRSEGRETWEPGRCLSWETWVTRLWRDLVLTGGGAPAEGIPAPMLMNASQETAVWRWVLEESEVRVETLRPVESLAAMAAGAWRSLCAYRGQGDHRRWAATGDAGTFQRWAEQFGRRCRTEGLLSRAGLEEALRRSVETGEIAAEGWRIVLLGFDRMTPAQAALVEAVRSAGDEVAEISQKNSHGPCVLVDAADEAAELHGCARWVRQFLERQPGARVAVIVPEMRGLRSEIDRVFREVLAPETEDVTETVAAPYEFSLGVPLLSTPMVLAAMDLLRWVGCPLPIDRVSGLVLSPYFAAQEAERGARAEFDAFDLRGSKRLLPQVRVDQALRLAERAGKGGGRAVRMPLLLGTLRKLAGLGIDFAAEQTCGEWAQAMRDVLVAARWGAGGGGDSVEFQTRRRWESALDELATLDFDGREVSWGEAVKELGRIATEAVFAPESRGAPVQVMGPIEAAGSEFDAAWFLRAGDLAWPVRPGSSPLLPWGLKKDLGMPGTDAAEDAQRAREVTERVARSATEVVFSYARLTAEGGRQRSSAALPANLEPSLIEELAGTEAVREVVTVEAVTDAEKLPPLPDEEMRGGTSILKLQAACGFRAFAERRLRAREIEGVELGLNAMRRGGVVHKALELFWTEVRSHAALRQMTNDERNEVLGWCIDRTLEEDERHAESAWERAYLMGEKRRLLRLLDEWMKFELERPPFEVKTVEYKREVQVGPLRLGLRIDRIDSTEGGDLVIDYKTGKPAKTAWKGDRPDEPQVPMYAIFSGAEDLGGVAFGQVRIGREMAMPGLVRGDGVLPPSKRGPEMEGGSFEGQVDRWREVLERLATEFAEGDARVRPKAYPKTCQYCAQRLLCRVDASLLEEEYEEEGADGPEAR